MSHIAQAQESAVGLVLELSTDRKRRATRRLTRFAGRHPEATLEHPAEMGRVRDPPATADRIRLRAGAAPLDAGAVREFATGRLAQYKIPRYVKLVDEFPMTVTGKIRKVETRQRSTEELGLG